MLPFCTNYNRELGLMQSFLTIYLDTPKGGRFVKAGLFKSKVSLWKRRALRGILGSFPTLDGLILIGDDEPREALIQCIAEHLMSLEEKLYQYFPASQSIPAWIQQPILAEMDDDNPLREELLEMKTNLGVKVIFENLPLADFWCSQLESYPNLTHSALQNVLPLILRICAGRLLGLDTNKTQASNRLGDVDHDMRLALSITSPRINLLVDSKKQEQKSH